MDDVHETALDLSSAFLRFKDYLGESSSDVTAVAAELLAINAAIGDLNIATEPRLGRRRTDVDTERHIVVESIEATFKDIRRLFGHLDQPLKSKRETYRSVWNQIDKYFRKEGFPLLRRLEIYKQTLRDLCNMVNKRSTSGDYDDNYDRIVSLRRIQGDDLSDEMENLVLGTSRQKSWERKRPYGLNAYDGPSGRYGGMPGYHKPGYEYPTSPLSPPLGIDINDYIYPPRVPEPPSSPTMTTTTESTQSSSGRSNSVDHWVADVFAASRSTTIFNSTGSESIVTGEHMPHATSRLKGEYDELLRLPFETGFLEVRIYLRPDDRRARLLCRMDRGHSKLQSSFPVTALRIVRRDSCLQICVPDKYRRWILWTNLRFTSYERMVLFHNTFLALKAQDENDPVEKLEDHILHGEIPVFSGVIIDDGYQHALQIFKDADSGGVRLQASVYRGQMQKAPVWTAFINYTMASLRWIVQVEPRKVHIRDLRRYIFTFDYQSQLAPNGEHELFFMSPSDAVQFMQAVEDVAEGKI